MEDRTDEIILRELRQNAKATMGAIAKRTGIPATTVHNRIKRMEKEGIIKSYKPVLDYTKLGLGIHALIFINAEHRTDQEQLSRKLLALHRVESVRIITGGFDLVAEVRAASIEELNTFIIKDLHLVPGIEKTQTMIVLNDLRR